MANEFYFLLKKQNIKYNVDIGCNVLTARLLYSSYNSVLQ